MPDIGIRLTGRVVTPSSPDYDVARQSNIKFFDFFPAYIVFVQSVRDIQNALAFVRRRNLGVRIRSGRNSISGSSNANSILVIDVSELKAIRIDRRRMLVHVGGGIKQGELLDALANTGFFAALGDERLLGLAPVTLGGGIGSLSRIKGLGCDNVAEFETVLADGQVVRANERQHSDLYWASRGGGGGNFGVVSHFTMYLYHAPRVVVSFKGTWPMSAFIDAYDTWQHWGLKQGHQMGSKSTLAGGTYEIVGVFLGTRKELGHKLAPLMKVPGGTWSVIEEPFAVWYRSKDTTEALYQHYTSGWVLKPLPREALRVVRSFMEIAPSPASTWFSLLMGGHVRHIPKGGTAFPASHRAAIMYAEASCEFDDPTLRGTALGWNARFRNALQRWLFGGYVNVQQNEIEEWGETYYGVRNYDRLQRVKAAYDPENLFYGTQSIPPCDEPPSESEGSAPPCLEADD